MIKAEFDIQQKHLATKSCRNHDNFHTFYTYTCNLLMFELEQSRS
jgi:hypothetical protein